MRKRKQWLFIIVIAVILLSGCGKSVSPSNKITVIDRNETKSKETRPEVEKWNTLSPLVWESEEDTNLAGLLQEQGTKAMVSLEAGGLRGSGMIYDVHEDTMLVITAAHVLEQATDAVIMQLVDGTNLVSREYELYAEDDLAILTAECSDLNAAAIKTLLIDDTKFQTCVAGDTCIAMGGSERPGEEAYEGTILEVITYLADYGRNMTLAQGICEPGMSGGGLFDSRGYLLGLLSGFDEAGRIAVVPLPVIQERVHSFLNNES